jgi:drug/metabolite transporter (DMT)-like permease
MKDDTKGLLLGLLGVALFSLTLPATRIAVASLDPVTVGLGRAVVAALLAGALLLATRQRWPRGREWRSLAIVALGVVLGFPLLSAWAMTQVPAAHGAVVLGVLPLATAAFGALLAGERPVPLFWAVGLLGSALVVVFALREGGGEVTWPDLALLAAVAAAALGYAEGARLSRTLGGWQVISWALVLSAPFLLWPVAEAVAEVELAALPWQAWAAFAYVALISQFVAFFAWYRGLALGGIAKVGQLQLLQAFFTLGFAALLNGEAIGWDTLGFALAVVACVAVGRRLPVRR